MGQEDTTTRALIYPNQPLLGRLYTQPPAILLIAASLTASLGLLVPAYLLHLSSIPTSSGNLGFYSRYHWSVMYTIVVPIVLAMTSAISRRMKDCVVELSSNGRITVRSGTEAPPYPEALAHFIGQHRRRLIYTCLGISLLIVGLDTLDLWPSFITGHVSASRKPEWDTAFNAGRWDLRFYGSPSFDLYLRHIPSRIGNLAFDVIAYTFEGVALFLIFFWGGTFLLYLLAFAQLIGGREALYQFNPLTYDLDFRMGLKPMGRLFDNFLTMTLIIEIYAFYHRLQLIGLARHQPTSLFLGTILRNIALPPKEDTNLTFSPPLVELFRSSSWAFDGVDRSALLTIIFMTAPIAIVSYLPLWQIRRLAEESRDRELARISEKYKQALDEKNYYHLKVILYEKQLLEKANIWPNGDVRAKRYLVFIMAMAAGAISPPAALIVIGVSLTMGLYSAVKSIFVQDRAGDKSLGADRETFSLYQTNIQEVHMDEYNNYGNAGAMGNKAKAKKFSQEASPSPKDPVDLSDLKKELTQLRKVALQEATAPEHYTAIANIKAAEEAADAKDQPSVLRHLQSAGKWILDLTGKAGASVVAKLIEQQIGMS